MSDASFWAAANARVTCGEMVALGIRDKHLIKRPAPVLDPARISSRSHKALAYTRHVTLRAPFTQPHSPTQADPCEGGMECGARQGP